MKTVEQIVDELHAASSWKVKEKVIRRYAEEIIDECAGSFECTMEADEGYTGEESIYSSHPVLVRQSVLNVKERL